MEENNNNIQIEFREKILNIYEILRKNETCKTINNVVAKDFKYYKILNKVVAFRVNNAPVNSRSFINNLRFNIVHAKFERLGK